jgi:hypothetical protein
MPQKQKSPAAEKELADHKSSSKKQKKQQT